MPEPPSHGIGTKGTELLRCHRPSGGGAQHAPPFDVARSERLVVLDRTCDRPCPHATRDDRATATSPAPP